MSTARSAEEYVEQEEALVRGSVRRLSDTDTYHLDPDCGYIQSGNTAVVPWSEVQRYRLRPCSGCAPDAPGPLWG